MYSTIYIGEKPIILIEQGDPSFEHYRHDPDIIFFDEISSKVVHSALHEIKRDSIIKVVICQPDLRALQHAFFKHFTLIQAAGGLVENDEGNLEYSQYRHDYKSFKNGNMIDGGRDYIRSSGKVFVYVVRDGKMITHGVNNVNI